MKIEELAGLANMSYRSYTEQFKRRTGKTVTQYLAERRVEYAKRLRRPRSFAALACARR